MVTLFFNVSGEKKNAVRREKIAMVQLKECDAF